MEHSALSFKMGCEIVHYIILAFVTTFMNKIYNNKEITKLLNFCCLDRECPFWASVLYEKCRYLE
jgi:hypothetical protein